MYIVGRYKKVHGMLSYRIPIKRILLNEYIVDIRNVVCKGYNYECWRESGLGLKGESKSGLESAQTRTHTPMGWDSIAFDSDSGLKHSE